jgi:hypothetical protein
MTVEIPLTRGYVAIVDDEDADLAELKWWADVTPRSVYAVRGRQVVRMHRVVMARVLGRALERHEHVDHIRPGIAGGLDNRRDNLRLATQRENGQHRRTDRAYAGKPTSSRYKGVSWHKRQCRWIPRIMVNGEHIHLGSWRCEKLAALTYDDAARKHHGQFARINFPGPGESSALEV